MIVRGVATENYSEKHVPSVVMPDTLYYFTTNLRWLLDILQYKMLSPRYCEEDISYLGIKNPSKIAIPMRCFCDIGMSKLSYHMEWYGDYGIAFEKAWCIAHGLQPLQYINSKSALKSDMAKCFKTAMSQLGKKLSKEEAIYRNFILHELMYYKPYQGKMENRRTKKMATKCLADECEWRYIPNTSSIGMPQVFVNNFGKLKDYSDALIHREETALKFEYSEIKHIIIKDLTEYEKVIQDMGKWSIDDIDRYTILSRIIVWDETRGDL